MLLEPGTGTYPRSRHYVRREAILLLRSLWLLYGLWLAYGSLAVCHLQATARDM